MADRDALLALAERVEGLTGPDREVDAAIADAVRWWPEGYNRKDVGGSDRRWADWKGVRGNRLSDRVDCPTYTSSLDAAMSLVPEGWEVARAAWHSLTAPAAGFQLFQHRRNERGEWWHSSKEAIVNGEATTPALALTAACLRARAAAIGSGEGA